MSVSEMIQWIEGNEQEWVHLWGTLVNIDSGTYIKKGVDAVGGILRQELERMGFELMIHPQEKFGDHLIARKFGTGTKRILLVGHMDTVFPDLEAVKRPFRIDGGRAYGPGVHDMKGGLVVMTAALQTLTVFGYQGYDTLTILLNSDEEVGSPSSREIIEIEARKADAVFVFEPARTDRALVTARKGVGMYHMAVTGRAAHAGADPQAGISAVEELAHKTIALHKLTNFDTGTTVNVGTVAGGTRSNVIAESAKGDIDVRFFSREEAERVDKTIQEIANHSFLPGTTTVLTGGINRPAMEKNEGTIRLFELVKKAGEELGIAVHDVASGGASDGNFTSGVGAATIDSMGTAGGLAHGLSEYAEVDSLLEKIKLTALILMKAAE